MRSFTTAVAAAATAMLLAAATLAQTANQAPAKAAEHTPRDALNQASKPSKPGDQELMKECIIREQADHVELSRGDAARACREHLKFKGEEAPAR